MKKENYSFKQACAVVGGQSAMARLLGVSPPSVNQWIKGVRQLPAERCPAIERATRVRFCAKNFVLILTGHIYDVRHVVRRICQ